MKLTQKAIDAITVRTKNRIALELNCSVPTVDRWIKENEDNGDMTKAKVVEIIQEETELLKGQILEVSKTNKIKA